MKLTASGLDRAQACPGSLALTQHPHSTSDSDHGSMVHHFLDRVATVGREKALGEIEDADDQSCCAAIDLAGIPEGSESEVAFAYDLAADRAERLTLDEHRAYPDDGRIYGTADRVGVRERVVYVGDVKTGKSGRVAAEAMQLRFLALAACRVAGLDEAHVSMLYLRHDGRWFEDHATFDAFDLCAIRDELLAIRASEEEAQRVVAAGGLPQLLPGIHCEHCAAAPECPAQERQQRAMVLHAPESLDEWISSLPDAEAGEVVERAIVVAKLAEHVRDAANARVRAQGELVLPSGRMLKRVAYRAQKQDETAKSEIAAVKDRMREEGHITSEPTWQVRVVGGARKR